VGDRLRGVLFVEDRIGNNIFFGGPGAEIEQAATLRTEGEIRMLGGVRRLLADGQRCSYQRRVLPQTRG